MLAFANFLSACPRTSFKSSLNPLEDRRVLVAAPNTYAAHICPRLIEKSARPFHVPLISNIPLPDSELFDLEEAILRLSDYDVLTFISTMAISTFSQKLRALCESEDQAVLMLRASGIRIATFGANGNVVSRVLGVNPDILPLDPSLAGLADLMSNDETVRGARVLCPVPELSGVLELPHYNEFKIQISRAGLTVNSVPAYSAMPIARERVDMELKLLLNGSLDALLMSSQDEARALHTLLSDPERDSLLSLVKNGKPLLVAHDSDTAAVVAKVLGAEHVISSQGWASYKGVIDAMVEKFAEAMSGNGLLLPS